MHTRSSILLLPLFLLLVCPGVHGQVQVDKPIQLTGSGADGTLTGIKQVTQLQDAASADAVQKGSVLYAPATGSSNAFAVTLVPAPVAYTEGMEVRFRANHAISGPATLNVNGLGAVSIRRNVNSPLSSCDIALNQVVSVVYDGTNFQMISPAFSETVSAYAGPDQTVTGTSATLGAVNPAPASGVWTIQAGAGGSVASPSQFNSNFTGNLNTTYVLRWTVTGTCGSTAFDEVSITFQAPVKRVFTTASTGSGNFSTWANAGGFTGLTAADRICRMDANNPLGAGNGNWKAYVSTTTVHAKDRIQDAEYRRSDNVTVIAYNKADLTDGTLVNPISTSLWLVWTGSNTNGTYFSGVGACSDWTLGSGGNGVIGKANQSSSDWAVYTYNYGCTGTNIGEGGNVIRLYCFED